MELRIKKFLEHQTAIFEFTRRKPESNESRPQFRKLSYRYLNVICESMEEDTIISLQISVERTPLPVGVVPPSCNATIVEYVEKIHALILEEYLESRKQSEEDIRTLEGRQ